MSHLVEDRLNELIATLSLGVLVAPGVGFPNEVVVALVRPAQRRLDAPLALLLFAKMKHDKVVSLAAVRLADAVHPFVGDVAALANGWDQLWPVVDFHREVRPAHRVKRPEDVPLLLWYGTPLLNGRVGGDDDEFVHSYTMNRSTTKIAHENTTVVTATAPAT